jgi:hypothetical protein
VRVGRLRCGLARAPTVVEGFGEQRRCLVGRLPGDRIVAVPAQLLDVAEPRAAEESLMRAGQRIATLARQAAELVSAFPG